LDANAGNPADVWALDAAFGYDINAAMPVELDGVVFYGTMRGLLMAVDAKSGVLLWKHRVGPSPLNTVAPVSRNRVVCTDFDGRGT
jgi:outer membrane protein assembly factor BamB